MYAWYSPRVMRSTIVLAIALTACGGETGSPASNQMSREPVSVRGWIADVEGAVNEETFRTVETEMARRAEMFQKTNVWIDNVTYVSGGVGGDGSFILLDVPPGNVTISFSAPGAETASLTLENIPGNADVLVPGLILNKDGSTVSDPEAIRVRLPSRTTAPKVTAARALVQGHSVPVVEVPFSEMNDRRDYPVPPGGRGVATVR